MKGLDAPFCVGPWMTEELDHHLGVCGLTEGAARADPMTSMLSRSLSLSPWLGCLPFNVVVQAATHLGLSVL